MLKAGIIDSGANIAALGLPAGRINGTHLYRDEDGKLQTGTCIADNLSHGTACIAAILSFVPDACFYVVKIFDKVPAADEELLVAAIRLCMAQQVTLINVSLGIQATHISQALFDTCEAAAAAHIPIVAAAHLDDKICFPAHHPQVISVGNLHMQSPVELAQVSRSPVTVYTKGEVFFNNKRYYGSSFACSRVSGQLLQLAGQMPGSSLPALKAALTAKACLLEMPYGFCFPQTPGPPDSAGLSQLPAMYFNPMAAIPFARKVLVLPLKDEHMKAVAANLAAGSGHTQLTVSELGYYPYHIPALINKAGADNEFDTIALGSLSSLLSFYTYTSLCQQLKVLLKKDKNFIVYDEADHALLLQLKAGVRSRSRVWNAALPPSCINDFKPCRYLPPVQTPVLAITGISIPGVITAQVKLYQYFTQAGYAVEYIAPVLQAALAGARFAYPVPGIDGAGIQEQELTQFLQHLLKAVQHFYQPDFIITGLPGFTTAGRPGSAAIAPLAFLKGLQPDAFIIAVHPDDDLQEILNHYHITSSITNTHRCCFLYTGNAGHAENSLLQEQLLPYGPVIYTAAPQCFEELENVVRSFFSLQPMPNMAGY